MAEPNGGYVPGLVWTRQRPVARGTRPSLDRATIVRGAIELLDEHGLPGLSMRQLGSHLNSGATTLYWHVANKEELLDLAFDEVMAELPDPDPSSDWRDQVELLLGGLRDMMLRHPWYVKLYGDRPAFGPRATRFNANLLMVLKRAGFEDDLLDRAHSALLHYAIGAITNELNWHAWSRLPKEQFEAMIDYIGEAVRPYPDYARYYEYLRAADASTLLQARFTTALQSLLDGLAIRLEGK